MTNFLILGATGFVGRSVCEKLVERSGGGDGRIRVATRRFPRARHLQLLPTVEIACGDIHDDATLARMLRDTDVVINLVAILHGSEKEFERVHVRLPRAARRRPAATPACVASSTSARSARRSMRRAGTCARRRAAKRRCARPGSTSPSCALR